VAEGVRALQGLLPDKWSSVRVLESAGGERRHGGELMDALVHVGAPGGQGATLLVEAKSGFAPRDVELVVGRLRRAVDQLGRTAAGVVFAPWLSARTRSLLDAAGVGYLDLTGNVHLRLAEPALFIRVSGAERDPAPVRRASLSLRGRGRSGGAVPRRRGTALHSQCGSGVRGGERAVRVSAAEHARPRGVGGVNRPGFDAASFLAKDADHGEEVFH